MKLAKGNILSLEFPTFPTQVEAHKPYNFGNIVGVTTTDVEAGQIGGLEIKGLFALEVNAADDEGNADVAIGDKIYIENTNKSLSKKSTGVFFGNAVGAISAGETKVIPVIL